MDDEKRVIVDLRLRRSKEELQAAHKLLESGFFRIAASRAYYAAYLVTTAALYVDDIVRAKHSGVQSAFGESLIKTGAIEEEYGRIYTRLRKSREEGDYSDTVQISKELAQSRIAEAERYVERLESYLIERLGD
jgi:uncharacterized protein (UPF0332 family)